MVDLVCIFAALFFFSSNLLEIIAESERKKQHSTNYEALHELNPEYLMEKWLVSDTTLRNLFLSAGVLKTVAWFTFVVPVLQLAWLLSRGGKRKIGCHATMTALGLGGTMAELISRLMIIGSYNAARWIANEFNLSDWTEEGLDNIGWRVLEVVYIVVQGSILWIDAFEWLALFGIMSCLYYSIVTLPDDSRILGVWLARIGLLIGFLCLFDFVADILRFTAWSTYAKLAVFISILNTLILLPVWLIMLAIQLPGAKLKHEVPDDEEEALVSAKDNTNHVL